MSNHIHASVMNPSTGTLSSDRSRVRENIASLGPWFHNVHLPNGEQTAPEHWLGDFPRFKWKQIAEYIPADLTGWKVLDVGCNAGFYSIELAIRGADVRAVDADPRYLQQAQWSAEQFGLKDKITFQQIQVYELGRDSETYDLVWFMGVFYHLRYPLLGLEIVSKKAKKLFMFQTFTAPGEKVTHPEPNVSMDDRARLTDEGWPRMSFIEHQLADDPTNWWAPNHACVEAMLRDCGMEVIQRPAHEMYLCQPSEHPPTRDDAEYRAALGLS
jgi:tRNA (mo5U34)-methyltransferase